MICFVDFMEINCSIVQLIDELYDFWTVVFEQIACEDCKFFYSEIEKKRFSVDCNRLTIGSEFDTIICELFTSIYGSLNSFAGQRCEPKCDKFWVMKR